MLSCSFGQLTRCKATGHDDLSPIVLKRCSSVLAHSVCSIFNASFIQCRVPHAFKRANIAPLFKGGDDPTSASKYRPISLLPVLSRLLEKVVQSQLSFHFEEHNILPDTQFAYKKNHSTEDLVLACNHWLESKHRRRITGLAFVDMSKAFDKVRHPLLIQDLFMSHVQGPALMWFVSYLSDRLQRVSSHSDFSSYTPCTRGVPQGSVLGPILFSLYIRDIAQHLPNDVSNQEFADDIMLECCHQNPHVVADNLSTAVTDLSAWLFSRGLELNTKKTQALFIPPRGVNFDHHTMVFCGSHQLEVVSQARYLGLLVDSGLTYEPHVRNVVKRAKRSVSALWKARSSLNHQSKRMLYFSLIQSTLLYASNAFFPCLSVGTFDLLVKVTKNAVRAAFGLPSWTSSSPAFLALDLPPLLQVCRQKVVQFVFRVLHGRTSSLLQHHFSCTVTARNQERNTIVVPFWPGPAGRSTIQFRGALLWNSLPPTVREITEYAQFTAMVKAIRLE